MSVQVTDAETITFTLDGVAVEARHGELVIAAAERAGVYIPRFCYHPRMRPVGMCRMCLVEIDTGRGPSLQTACTVAVAPDMQVLTESERTRKAQDGVLELLLINHPLDCPVCDKGGECPLQDQTLAFGPGESRFVEEKRHFAKPIPISDLVLLDRERCILCDRCTRFAREVAGDPLISFIDRGNETQVNTFPDDPFSSYFSGNTVQICPVGALTAKPYRFKARPWDLDQVESTCTSCAVGCRVAVESSANRIVRYLGIDVDPVNWGWLCDKGRFDFEAVHSDDRLSAPQCRQGDTLTEVSWSDALDAAAQGLGAAEGTVAVLGGARLTNEDAYAWSKLARTVLGTDSIDAQLGDGLAAEVVLGLPRASIDAACNADTVLLLAPDLKEELPVLFLRLRDAVVRRGRRIIELSAAETSMTPHAAVSLRYHPGEAPAAVRSLLDGELGDAGKVVCVLGRPSVAESGESMAHAASALLEALPDVTFLPALRRGNVLGALDMGLAPGLLPGRVSLDEGRDWFRDWGELPSTRGLDATGILTAAADGRIAALVLLGADPLSDFPDHELASRALSETGFVLAVDCHPTESAQRAHVVLPAAGYAEKSGTTTNIEGRVSRLNQKITPPGTARPDWVIAVELAERMDADLGFTTLAELWDEVERLAPSHAGITRARLASAEGLDGILAGEVAGPEEEDAPPAPHGADESATDQQSGASGEAAGAAGDAAGYADGPDDGTAEAIERSVVDEHAGQTEAPAPAPLSRPGLLRYRGSGSDAPLPAADSYSLRLVARRKLYDCGTLVQHSPSLAHLAAPTPLQVNPTDLQRLGLDSGAEVRVTSSRTSLVMRALADPAVERGTAVLTFNTPGGEAAKLIDVTKQVTDLRVSTVDSR